MAVIAVITVAALMSAASPEDSKPAATNPDNRIAVPAAAAQTEAKKLVADVFKAKLAAALKAPEKKADLAVDLLKTALDERSDHTNQYVLLTMARDEALEASDLRLACRAIDESAKRFAVDPWSEKSAAAVAVARQPIPPLDRRFVAQQLLALADAAVVAERFDTAPAFDELARTVATSAGDPPLVEQVKLATKAHVEAKKNTALLAQARQTLAVDNADAASLLVAGRYDCFDKQDWDHGLPELAGCADAGLKHAAALETAHSAELADRVAAADAWYELAGPDKSPDRPAIAAHALQLYANLSGSLTGLARAKAEKRRQELQKIRGSGPPRAVDVLELIDPARDTCDGAWEKSAVDGSLVSGTAEHTRISVPYHPPLEYDFRIDFTRDGGDDAIDAFCIGGETGRPFTYTLGGFSNTIAGIAMVEGVGSDHNPTTTRGHWLDNGRRHVFVVRVRAGSISAFLDGKPVGPGLKTDFRDVQLHHGFEMKRPDEMGIGAWNSKFTIHSAYVVEVAGHGSVVDRDAPADQSIMATADYLGPGNNHQLEKVEMYADGRASTVDSDRGKWFLRGDHLIFRWDDFVDTCQLAPDRKSFNGTTNNGDKVHGDIVSGGI